MFIFLPKHVMQFMGLIMGVFFNIMIAGVFIKMTILCFNEGEWFSFWVCLGLAIVLGLWSFYLIRTTYKDHRSKKTKISLSEVEKKADSFDK